MNAIRLMLLTTKTTATSMQHAPTFLVTSLVNVILAGLVMEKLAQILMSVLLIISINVMLKQLLATITLEVPLDTNAIAYAGTKKLITRLGSSVLYDVIQGHDFRIRES